MKIARKTRAARLKSVPSFVVHEPTLARARRQTQIGVVDPQQQPMLRARGEHSVRFEAAFRDQIVDKNADVRFVAPQLEPRSGARALRRIDAGDKSLRRRLLVSRCPVDLAGEKQSRDTLRFEAP